MEHNGDNRHTDKWHEQQPTYQSDTTYRQRLNAPPTQSPKPPKTKKSGISALAGAVIGGIISAAIVVFLFTNHIIPIDSSHEGEPAVPAGKNSTSDGVVETISEDADVADGIDEATEAVVGVVKLQQQSIWTSGEEVGTGSGIIYKKEDGKAFVVTNQHVVEDAQEVEVVLDEEERVKANVLGTDELTDLAVLQIDGKHVSTVAQLGSSADLKAGETVIAIGNPLGMDFANTLTKGIISGLNRSISIDTTGNGQPDWVTEVIQTDAAINPGNSGGALVNTDGEVIGINSMKIARQEVEGIGFAIPIDSALPIMEQLEVDGKVARPFIGVTMAPINQVPAQYRNQVQLPDDVEGNVVIAQVETGSPADEAGLQQFDIITKIDGENITSILDLRKYLYSETEVGDTLEMEIYRNGQAQTVTLELAQRQE
ncbi:MAG TPA: trypsin-like peptidase domain-containing protein [Bacillota bacterium]|nr:trypsin-like peptidase domain-containing protein [Bacillota bacterium]